MEIDAALTTFHISDAALQLALRNPVNVDLARRAIKVEGAAKQYATGQGGGPNVRTGRLRGSITWRLGHDAGPYADIGSAVEYAPYVELGTSRMPAYPFLRPALEAARI